MFLKYLAVEDGTSGDNISLNIVYLLVIVISNNNLTNCIFLKTVQTQNCYFVNKKMELVVSGVKKYRHAAFFVIW